MGPRQIQPSYEWIDGIDDVSDDDRDDEDDNYLNDDGDNDKNENGIDATSCMHFNMMLN